MMFVAVDALVRVLVVLAESELLRTVGITNLIDQLYVCCLIRSHPPEP